MSRRSVEPLPADYNLGEKALACLAMAALRATDPERDRLYAAACARWSEKAVCAKFQELVGRGYMECGVSTSWLSSGGGHELRPRRHLARLPDGRRPRHRHRGPHAHHRRTPPMTRRHGKAPSECCNADVDFRMNGEWPEFSCSSCSKPTDEDGKVYRYLPTDPARASGVQQIETPNPDTRP